MVVITLLFFLPQFYPFWGSANINNFNWAGPVFVVLLVIIGGWWLISARKWFTGPVAMGDEATLEQLDEAVVEHQHEAEEEHLHHDH